MHETAMASGKIFAQLYGGPNKVVLDIGGRNVNGSLRKFFEDAGMKYICVDMEEDSSVDIVVKPGVALPFENASIDLIVSTSCFEHDPCFWITFKEMTRIIRSDGFIYINAPSNGYYHGYPGDNWRFFADAGQALSYWSSFKYANEPTFPVKVIETFFILPKNATWKDFICIWKRVEEHQTDIVVPKSIKEKVGILEKSLNDAQYPTTKMS